MKSNYHDISLLLENMVLLMMEQTGTEQELLIRALLKSELYNGLLSGEIDIAKITPKEAVIRFKAEEGN